MGRGRSIGLLLVVSCVLGGVVASSAQASSAPFWSVKGKRLGANETQNFGGRVLHGTSEIVLKTPEAGITVGCKRVETEAGVLLGSAEGEPGRASMVIRASECSLKEGNGTGCKLASQQETEIQTNPLRAELTESWGQGNGGPLLLEIFPETGTSFTTLKFGPTADCAITETKVTGKLAAYVLTAESKDERIELPSKDILNVAWVLRFPSPPIHSVWLITAAGSKLVTTEVVAFGDRAELIGSELVLLDNSSCAPVYELWSPLP
jgi:hypothetical protein